MLAVAVMMILGVMLLPMPTFIIDMFLVMNITGALVIIFVAMFVLRPLEFSVFPGLLLIVTLFRLSLNVATTRLILSEAYGGEIIDAFGNFVVGGNIRDGKKNLFGPLIPVQSLVEESYPTQVQGSIN